MADIMITARDRMSDTLKNIMTFYWNEYGVCDKFHKWNFLYLIKNLLQFTALNSILKSIRYLLGGRNNCGRIL